MVLSSHQTETTMILSDQNRQTLLVDLHRLISEQAKLTITAIMDHPDHDRSIYPPDTSLSDDEKRALMRMNHDEATKSALEKVLQDFTAKIFFRFFNIIDRTLLPDSRSGAWSPVTLADLPEGYNQNLAYLHDHFLETYWDWKEKFAAQSQAE